MASFGIPGPIPWSYLYTVIGEAHPFPPLKFKELKETALIEPLVSVNVKINSLN
jgi:hypothetical protein